MIKKTYFRIAVAIILIVGFACSKNSVGNTPSNPIGNTPSGPAIEYWMTKADQSVLPW